MANGNYTDGEEEDVTIPDASKEYPLQRDEVKVTSTRVNRNSTSVPSSSGGRANGEVKHYIGFVIGVLTVVILALVAAIVFIVFRNQRLKMFVEQSSAPDNDKRIDDELKVRNDLCWRDFILQSILERL